MPASPQQRLPLRYMPASAREAFATRAGLAACRSGSGRYNDAGTTRHLLAELERQEKIGGMAQLRAQKTRCAPRGEIFATLRIHGRAGAARGILARSRKARAA